MLVLESAQDFGYRKGKPIVNFKCTMSPNAIGSIFSQECVERYLLPDDVASAATVRHSTAVYNEYLCAMPFKGSLERSCKFSRNFLKLSLSLGLFCFLNVGVSTIRRTFQEHAHCKA